jgi:lysophospholipase L1-like esterase
MDRISYPLRSLGSPLSRLGGLLLLALSPLLGAGCVQGGPGPMSAGGSAPFGGENPGGASGGSIVASGGSVAVAGGAGPKGGSPAGGTTSGGTSSGGASSGGTANLGGAPGSGGASTDTGVVLKGVRWIGRVEQVDEPRFAWSGTGFVANVSGTGLKATLRNDDGFVFQVVVDGTRQSSWAASAGEGTYTLAEGLSPGTHLVELYRQTEGQYGNSVLTGLEAVGGELEAPPLAPRGLIEIVGDSISAGYGNLGADRNCPFSYDTESHYDTYGAIAGRLLGADVHTIATSGHGVVRNYDGATTDLLPEVYERTLTNQPSLSWSFPKEPTVIVVNLGTNDFEGGDPGDPFEQAYAEFLLDLRRLHPQAFLLATLGPMMTDESLATARTYIQQAIADFSEQDGAAKVDFLEYPVRVEADLGCDWHPNVTKHQSMAELLAAKLQELGLF